MALRVGPASLPTERTTDRAAEPVPPVAAGHQPPSIRPAVPDQWDQIAEAVAQAESRAAVVSRHHEAAARQLDAAEYALRCVFSEVRAAIRGPVASTLDRVEPGPRNARS